MTARGYAATVRLMRWVRWAAILPVVLLTLALSSLAQPVWAHTGSVGTAIEAGPVHELPAEGPPRAHEASSTAAGFAWLPLLVALVIALAVRRHPRHALALMLVLLLTILAYQDALHSVHHGDDPAGAASCPVLAASPHILGTESEVVTLGIPTMLAQGPTPRPADPVPPDHVLRPDHGRAPPAPASA